MSYSIQKHKKFNERIKGIVKIDNEEFKNIILIIGKKCYLYDFLKKQIIYTFQYDNFTPNITSKPSILFNFEYYNEYRCDSIQQNSLKKKLLYGLTIFNYNLKKIIYIKSQNQNLDFSLHSISNENNIFETKKDKKLTVKMKSSTGFGSLKNEIWFFRNCGWVYWNGGFY